MATIKVSLDKRHAKEDGTYPLVLRITHNRQMRPISLKVSLTPSEWDDKTQLVTDERPDRVDLNFYVTTKKLELQRLILQLEQSGKPYTAKQIVELYKRPQKVQNIVSFASDLIAEMKAANKIGNARTYLQSINKLINSGYRTLTFEEMDYRFLQRFEAQMLAEGMKVNAISVYLRALRAIYNKAIKAGVVDRTHYPFQDFTIRSERTISRTLTREEMQRIESLDLKMTSALWKYRAFFLLSFYLIGMSFIDLAFLRVKDIQNGRVIYRRRKTGKIYNIGLTEKASKLIAHFTDLKTADPEAFVLPIIPPGLKDLEAKIKQSRETYRHCNKALKRIARLCQIDKPISTYYARYSWANIARVYFGTNSPTYFGANSPTWE